MPDKAYSGSFDGAGGDDASRPPKNEAKSAKRALDVLEYFGIAQKPLRAKHIAQALNIHPSSTDQLLKTMVKSGYLNFDPISKVYHPSPRLSGFAIWLTSDCFWKTDIHPLLEDLHVRTQAYVSLAVRNDNTMRIIDSVGDDLPKANGMSVSLHSVAGQAFLATCAEEETKRIIDRATLFRQLPKEHSEELLERIRITRRHGHAGGPSLHQPAWSIAIALPLHRATPNRTVVLGVTGAKEQLMSREDKIVEIMRQSAKMLLQDSAAAH